MPIDTLLFDADDTLWDFQVAARRVTRAMLDRGVERYPAIAALSVEQVLAIRRRLGNLPGHHDMVELRRETFRLALADAGVTDAELVEELTVGFLDGLTRDLPLYPDTTAVLRRLAPNYRMAVVSNGTKGPEAGGIEGFFEATVLGPIEGIPKPDPRLFHLALERMGRAVPSRTVVIGDSDRSDVAGAHAAGMRAILVDRRRTGSELADVIVHELSELPAAIAALGA